MATYFTAGLLLVEMARIACPTPRVGLYRQLSRRVQQGCNVLTVYVPFGRNAFTTASFVVRYGPPIRSMQYGIAGNTASRHRGWRRACRAG